MTMPKYAGGLGFRDIELFNLALLARQAWRLLQEPETLSARILRAVYYLDGDILTATKGSHPSKIWRSILEGRDTLRQGLIQRIGTGDDTNPWNDNWLPRGVAMRPIACLDPEAQDVPTRVAQLIKTTSASWNMQTLERFFLPIDIELIRAIPLSTRRTTDLWSWFFEKNGIFSVKSAYRMIVDTKRRREDWIEQRPESSNQDDEEKMWTKLWKVSVPSKLRVFLWRLAKNSIPTGDVRFHRNMATTAACSLCGKEDSWRHSLLECTMSRCIWALAPEHIVEHMENTREPSAKSWLFAMIKTLNHEDLTRCLVTLWAVWFAR
jgi:hypothetical protein